MGDAVSSWTVVQAIPALNPGGAERSTLEVAAALVAAGHRSIVVSAGGSWVAQLERQGSEHWSLPIGAKSPRSLLLLRTLRQRLQQERVDLVHARSRLPAWICWWMLARMQPRPAFVTTVHGLNSPGRYSGIMTMGDRVICVSETTRQHLLTHYPRCDPDKLRVIPRGVDPALFPHRFTPSKSWLTQFAQEFPQLSGGVLLTLPGRGTRLKGHLDAIRLLARLRRGGLDARLLLLGVVDPARADYLRELQSELRRLRVEDAVAMAPPRADVREIYATSKVVLQMSVRPESFGRVVVEALHVGTPVAGYAHGGVGELLAAHCPMGAAPLGDIDALAERVLAVLHARPQVDPAALPTVADLQARTLAVYAELLRKPAR